MCVVDEGKKRKEQRINSPFEMINMVNVTNRNDHDFDWRTTTQSWNGNTRVWIEATCFKWSFMAYFSFHIFASSALDAISDNGRTRKMCDQLNVLWHSNRYHHYGQCFSHYFKRKMHFDKIVIFILSSVVIVNFFSSRVHSPTERNGELWKRLKHRLCYQIITRNPKPNEKKMLQNIFIFNRESLIVNKLCANKGRSEKKWNWKWTNPI